MSPAMIDDWPAPSPPPPAQLAATLRMLEAVDDLRRDVDAIRVELRPLLVVSLMGAALVFTVASERLASRAAFVPPRFGFAHARPVVYDPPAETPLETDAWELARP